MKQDNSTKFVPINQAAKRYKINARMFIAWVDKIKNEMPLYEPEQKLFSPSQIRFFEAMFCNGDNTYIKKSDAPESLGKSELAERYGLSLPTFSKWIKKIENKIPFYVEGQRIYCSRQIEYIDSVFC